MEHVSMKSQSQQRHDATLLKREFWVTKDDGTKRLRDVKVPGSDIEAPD